MAPLDGHRVGGLDGSRNCPKGNETMSDHCIHGCYYVDTPDECYLDSKGSPKCKRACSTEMFNNILAKDVEHT